MHPPPPARRAAAVLRSMPFIAAVMLVGLASGCAVGDIVGDPTPRRHTARSDGAAADDADETDRLGDEDAEVPDDAAAPSASREAGASPTPEPSPAPEPEPDPDPGAGGGGGGGGGEPTPAPSPGAAPAPTRVCCALCRNRTRYHLVNVPMHCADAARAYCAVGDRGGLVDAMWGSCSP